MEIKNKYEEVKATLGYEIPLSSDTYSKEKATVYLSITIGGDELDKDLYRKEARKIAMELTQDTKAILLEQGEEIKQSIEELKNTRNPEIDKVREELDKEYREKMEKAKEMILDLKKQIKLSK
jgi:gas vesicle protein